MKRLILIFVLCGLFFPSAYGETISHTFPNGNKYVGEVKISNGTGKLHGQGTYTYANGEKYVGEYRNGNKHGRGTYTWPDGSKYVGEFKDGKSHGQGTYTYPDGHKHVGEYKNGKKHGHGTYTYPGGHKYVGEYKGNKMHGQGTYTLADGDKYVGEWKDGEKHGQGTYTSASGTKYVGEYRNGKRNGQGTLTYPDGNKYVGEYKGNKMHGQGTYTWANGTKYVGEWKDGDEHGQGTEIGIDGTKYVGEYRNGKSHGQGTYTWANGTKYVGEFKNNKRHGQGTYTWANGTKYVGEFKNNKRHGQGTYTSADGDKYVGEYKDNKMHGQGMYTLADGDKYVGEFKNHKKHGQGTITHSDGRKYVGQWKGEKQHGQGTYTWANGDKYVGKFKYGIKWEGAEYNASGKAIGRQLDGLPTRACAGNSPGRWGTGFAVSQHHVVTNAHVVYCCKKVTVLDLLCSDSKEATVVATEQKSDLGLLRRDKPLNHYATLRSGTELQLGEAVKTYDWKSEVNGCPRYVMGQGKVTKLNWMPDDFRVMFHDSPISQGSSGGPVLDASGYVVGMTIAGSHRKSAAVKPHLLKAFLESNSVEYKTAPSTEELRLSGIKKKSDKFTVIIKCETDSEPTVSKSSSKVTQAQAPTTTSSECKPKSQCFSLDASRGGYTKPEAGMSETTCKATGGKWRCIEDCDCK